MLLASYGIMCIATEVAKKEAGRHHTAFVLTTITHLNDPSGHVDQSFLGVLHQLRAGRVRSTRLHRGRWWIAMCVFVMPRRRRERGRQAATTDGKKKKRARENDGRVTLFIDSIVEMSDTCVQ